ncbi:MAG TPA: hypothetical protein VIP09_10190, partial [Dehalococcoidia bacterium]
MTDRLDPLIRASVALSARKSLLTIDIEGCTVSCTYNAERRRSSQEVIVESSQIGVAKSGDDTICCPARAGSCLSTERDDQVVTVCHTGAT